MFLSRTGLMTPTLKREERPVPGMLAPATRE
jgi:hypothetical protein